MDKVSYKLSLSKRRNRWGLYKVQVWKNDKPYEESSYETDDWRDAVGTFNQLARELSANNRITDKGKMIAYGECYEGC